MSRHPDNISLDNYCLDWYNSHMAPSTRSTVRRFDSPQQEAYLALWRTYDRLRAFEDEPFAEFDLTAQQYNLQIGRASCRERV